MVKMDRKNMKELGRMGEHMDHMFCGMKMDRRDKKGLIRMVNSRRKLLDYLKGKDPEAYSSVLEALNLRK